MRFSKQLLAVSIALAFAGVTQAQSAPAAPPTPAPTTQAASPLTETDVRQLLTTAGYTEVNDVKFKEGVWTADGKSADGNHVEVKVDASGKIIPDAKVANITKDQIIVKMQDAGYTKVHDVDFEGGVWKAEAVDSNGKDVEVKLDPNDGHILGSEQDKINNAGK
jgi:uncharacterized membrane protein YkoI